MPSLNFEDHDLLRTVGRHAATHIDQAGSDKRLAESSQFGAYQAREYVRQLVGHLAVTSNNDNGTTFSIELPLA